MENNDLWIFLHAPRTGGSTIIKYLTEAAPPGGVMMPSNLRYGEGKKNFDKSKVMFILGHATYWGMHKEFPGKNPKYFTFIRDPAERIVSYYNEKFKDYPEDKIVPFDKWYESQPKNEMVRFFNLKLQGSASSHIKVPKFLTFLVRIIKGKYGAFNFLHSSFRKISRQVSKEDLENAKNLLDRCDFVGIIENAKEDSKFLFDMIGIKCPEWERSSTYKKKLVTPTDEIRKKVYKDNPLDYELYNYALELNKKIKETPAPKQTAKKVK